LPGRGAPLSAYPSLRLADRARRRVGREEGSGRILQEASFPSQRRRRRCLRPGPVTETPRVTIWTDGACSGNPGPGGWGAILVYGATAKELKGGAPETTNNRMELTAAIEALDALTRPCAVDIHTDSQYVKGGITGWIFGWK